MLIIPQNNPNKIPYPVHLFHNTNMKVRVLTTSPYKSVNQLIPHTPTVQEATVNPPADKSTAASSQALPTRYH